MNTIVPAIGFGIVTASILAVAGVGFTLQFGVTNILNLAYGDIMTAAAFVAYLVTSAGLSVWLALVAGAAFGSVFSVLLNRCIYTPFVRRGTRLFGMIIVTIAVSLMVQNSLLAIFGANFFSLKMPHPSSVHIAGMVFTNVQLAIIAIAVVAMLLIHLLLRYTKLGKAMRATAAYPDLARNCGIATDRVLSTWPGPSRARCAVWPALMHPDELAERLAIAGARAGDQLRGHDRITSSSVASPRLPLLTPAGPETGRRRPGPRRPAGSPEIPRRASAQSAGRRVSASSAAKSHPRGPVTRSGSGPDAAGGPSQEVLTMPTFLFSYRVPADYQLGRPGSGRQLDRVLRRDG